MVHPHRHLARRFHAQVPIRRPADQLPTHNNLVPIDRPSMPSVTSATARMNLLLGLVRLVTERIETTRAEIDGSGYCASAT